MLQKMVEMHLSNVLGESALMMRPVLLSLKHSLR
jgi:hypothetical protein